MYPKTTIPVGSMVDMVSQTWLHSHYPGRNNLGHCNMFLLMSNRTVYRKITMLTVAITF